MATVWGINVILILVFAHFVGEYIKCLRDQRSRHNNQQLKTVNVARASLLDVSIDSAPLSQPLYYIMFFSYYMCEFMAIQFKSNLI